MISAVLGFLSSISLRGWVGIAATAIVIGGGAYQAGRYVEGERTKILVERARLAEREDIRSKIDKAIAEERERMEAIVAETQREAQGQLARLREKNDELETVLEEIDDEIAASGDGDSCGLDADSLRRLNRVR